MNETRNGLRSQCIREGGRSFHENRGQYINPYVPGSAQSNDFERGWSQALKRSPDRLLREYQGKRHACRRVPIVLPKSTGIRNKMDMSEDTYRLLASRARERLLKDPSYQSPRFEWKTIVYYVRLEAYDMPLWKVGITSNRINDRYCVRDRQLIVEIKSWQYDNREEAEAVEREILAEFVDDIYQGDPVLRSGGNSELFTRDVLKLDNQDDILARMRRERLT